MRTARPSPARTWILFALTLPTIVAPGCGPAPVVNSPEVYNFGSLEEVGSLYLSTSNRLNAPPKALADLAGSRDLFTVGYNAIEQGEVVVSWGVRATPGDTSGGAPEVLAYQADVPTQGGPVLLSDLTIETMTPEQFQDAPKAPGTSSATAAPGGS